MGRCPWAWSDAVQSRSVGVEWCRDEEGKMQLHSTTQDVSSLRKLPCLSLSEKLTL